MCFVVLDEHAYYRLKPRITEKHFFSSWHALVICQFQKKRSFKDIKKFVASELKDPIWHSSEWQIGSFSSEATNCSSHVFIIFFFHCPHLLFQKIVQCVFYFVALIKLSRIVRIVCLIHCTRINSKDFLFLSACFRPSSLYSIARSSLKMMYVT